MLKLISILFLSFFVFGCTNETVNNKQEVVKTFDNQFFAQLSIDDFKKELSDTGVVLIDVRTPEELVRYGKISNNQVNIDINNKDFTNRINNLDKTKKYLIYCWHGNRSRVARNYMKTQGFFYVKDLKGGIDAWEKAGENIIK